MIFKKIKKYLKTKKDITNSFTEEEILSVKKKGIARFDTIQDCCLRNDINGMKYLLKKQLISIDNQDDNLKTALHHACKYSHLHESLDFLLQYKADLNLTDKFGDTPIDIAIIFSNYPALIVLKKHNVLNNENINLKKLTVALEKNDLNVKFIKFLLEEGITFDIENINFKNVYYVIEFLLNFYNSPNVIFEKKYQKEIYQTTACSLLTESPKLWLRIKSKNAWEFLQFRKKFKAFEKELKIYNR